MTSSPQEPNKPDIPERPKHNEKIDNLYTYAKTNTLATVAYVFLIIGIVLLFFLPLYGGAIIGVVCGLFFSDEITARLRNANEFVEEQGMVRSLIIGGVILAFFIQAPAIFIAAAITVGLKQLIMPHDSPKSSDKGSDKL